MAAAARVLCLRECLQQNGRVPRELARTTKSSYSVARRADDRLVEF